MKNPERKSDKEKKEQKIAEQVDESFPASDPSSHLQPGSIDKEEISKEETKSHQKNKMDKQTEQIFPLSKETSPHGDPKRKKTRKNKEKLSEKTNEQVEESFPASEPPTQVQPGNKSKGEEDFTD
ncbi:MAG TPA: hypothetical protein VK021_04815 [Flavobacteriaceae bacterium]|nr:hypothetical protein [Flavobacteriaceae bacterium]